MAVALNFSAPLFRSSTFDDPAQIDQSTTPFQLPMTFISVSLFPFLRDAAGRRSDLHWRCSVLDDTTPALDGAASGRLTAGGRDDFKHGRRRCIKEKGH